MTIATYRRLAPALADWDALVARDRSGAIALIDAALVEGDIDTIRAIHRHPHTGCGRGAAAGALAGLLRPAALITGAVAGGVGDRVIVVLSQGLSRIELKRLGDLLDTEPIAVIVLSAEPDEVRWSTILGASTATASVETTVTDDAIRDALRADNADG